MEGGRARRQTVVDGRGGKKFKNALAELQELRKTGGMRADNYEYKEEESVYDEVDDDEYARIVQKRREEGGELLAALARRVPARTGCPSSNKNVLLWLTRTLLTCAQAGLWWARTASGTLTSGRRWTG